ncbi:hypothetical protein ACQPWY_26395 [Pseudonocardia xinjiangensis]|uniref:hypothetical protein n=1 Tax=Pseudonocardia xinjiangensis TaxID=75289 RepID=UPI003D8ED711
MFSRGAQEMDPTATAVIAAVLTAFGETVANDTWTGFKTMLSKILGRGDQAEIAREEEQLDRDRDKLVYAREAGDEGRIARIDAKWSERLIEFLEDHPEQIEALQELVNEYAGEQSTPPATSQSVNNRNTAFGNSRIISGGIGDVNVTLSRDE